MRYIRSTAVALWTRLCPLGRCSVWPLCAVIVIVGRVTKVYYCRCSTCASGYCPAYFFPDTRYRIGPDAAGPVAAARSLMEEGIASVPLRMRGPGRRGRGKVNSRVRPQEMKSASGRAKQPTPQTDAHSRQQAAFPFSPSPLTFPPRPLPPLLSLENVCLLRPAPAAAVVRE